jgi:O-antigen ligase
VVFILQQRRRWLLLSLAAGILPLVWLVAPMPEGYFERMQTIQTYEDVGETSALSRLHFWRVALRISADHPLGIGLWNFESVYDSYDDLEGLYGTRRAVHNSFLEALDEVGWLGSAVFVALFGYAFLVCFRVRKRARLPGLPPDDSHFLLTVGGALIASMSAFVVGGFFASMAYNDISWLTFGIVAATDRLSADLVGQTADHQPAGIPCEQPAAIPAGSGLTRRA